jgi:signal transduction histidine kinase
VQRAWRRQLTNVDRQNVATVRAISFAIDQQIDRTTAALDVLGELHALDVPELPAFQNLARRILPYQPHWSAILLADTSGKILVGVPDLIAGGAAVAGVNWAAAASAAKRTAVSDMFTVTGLPGRFVMVATPVVRNGRVSLVLGARLRTEGLSEILRQQQMPSNGAVALIAGDFRIIARARDEARYVGTPAVPAIVDGIRTSQEGALKVNARDGTPNYAAFSRSPRTGLTVALGLPAEEVDGPIRRILWNLAGAWFAVLAVGAGLGLFVGRIVVRALSSASSAAMALARGEPVDPPPSRIEEIDQLAVSLRRAGATLAEKQRERDEASRLKDEFLMTVSHELRTPLTAICGWARMLASGQIRDAQRPRAVDAIERNGLALQQLVEDLLDVSRIVAGKLRLEVQPVALGELVAASIDAIRPAADGKGVLLAADIDAAGSVVAGDPARLQQVLWNLLSNAVKFTPQGGRIDVGCHRNGSGVELTIKDTGIGIDGGFLPFVFDRFRQGASGTTRVHGGLGLGLSIVRDLVELHGGTVTAENNDPPPGSAFRVVLPASPAAMYSVAPGWHPRATSATTPTPPETAAR